MKIMLIAPPWIPLPPSGYGGIENVVFNLSEGLTKKGHEVTVFATGDSRISAHLKYLYPRHLGVEYVSYKSYPFFLLNHISFALQHIPDGTEIIHNHCEYAALHLLNFIKIPFVHTLHGAFYTDFDKDRQTYDQATSAFRETLSMFKDHPFVSISNAQRSGMPYLNYLATVYNGVDDNALCFNPEPDEYLAWLGRYSLLKGLPIAIAAVQNTKKTLKIGAQVLEKRKQQFEEEILAHVDGKNIILLGEIKTDVEKNVFLGNAKTLLMPVQWEEAFGMTTIEAMACGTPVIGFARGAMPEIIIDGTTGFLVNSSIDDQRGNYLTKQSGQAGIEEAIDRLYGLTENDYKQMRKACRDRVEHCFTTDSMVDGYLKAYETVLKNR
jgi:glycosyltransferase involved in cell wall biosynthesis